MILVVPWTNLNKQDVNSSLIMTQPTLMSYTFVLPYARTSWHYVCQTPHVAASFDWEAVLVAVLMSSAQQVNHCDKALVVSSNSLYLDSNDCTSQLLLATSPKLVLLILWFLMTNLKKLQQSWCLVLQSSKQWLMTRLVYWSCYG